MLYVIMFSKHRASQSFLSKTIYANMYSFKKAILRQVHVDQIGENIGGGFFENGGVTCLMKKTTITSSRIGGI
jgi:hypothetical protein